MASGPSQTRAAEPAHAFRATLRHHAVCNGGGGAGQSAEKPGCTPSCSVPFLSLLPFKQPLAGPNLARARRRPTQHRAATEPRLSQAACGSAGDSSTRDTGAPRQPL